MKGGERSKCVFREIGLRIFQVFSLGSPFERLVRKDAISRRFFKEAIRQSEKEREREEGAGTYIRGKELWNFNALVALWWDVVWWIFS